MIALITLVANKSVQILQPEKIGRLVEITVVSDDATDYIRVSAVKRDLDDSIATGTPIVAGMTRGFWVEPTHELFAISTGTPIVSVEKLSTLVAIDTGGPVIRM